MTQVQWECVDHATVTRYELGWARPDGTAPVAVAPLERPATLPTPVPAPPAPGYGAWVASVQAYGDDGSGGEVASGWSDPSQTVVFTPAKPSAVLIVIG